MRIQTFSFLKTSGLLCLLIFTAACNGGQKEGKTDDKGHPTYSLVYEVRLQPQEHAARVTLRLDEGAKNIRFFEFNTDPVHHKDFKGEGEVKIEGDHVRWVPPRQGGTLQYIFNIDHGRGQAGYDSLMTKDWTIFRGDELVPPARVRMEDGTTAKTTLKLETPGDWTAAAPYLKKNDGTYHISHPEHLFERPTGWFIAGHLGIVRERIAGMYVTIAAPLKQEFRRQDILAMLQWTLPTLEHILGQLPKRLLILGANDPMWRGGLSGPNSIYVHSDRPLITPDGTSPLLHELMHVAMRASSGPGGDWIVEGLAEFYSLKLLAESGGMSQKRYEKALTGIIERGEEVKKLRVKNSEGDVTARGVAVLHALDQQIRKDTIGKKNLDDVLGAMIQAPEEWTTTSFRAICEKTTGLDLEAFFQHWVPMPEK
jgi:hypothetical protein